MKAKLYFQEMKPIPAYIYNTFLCLFAIRRKIWKKKGGWWWKKHKKDLDEVSEDNIN